MVFRSVLLVATIAAAVLATTVSSEAAGAVIRGRFSYDGIATCQQPAVRNFPIHAEGTASLSTNRSARLDMSSNTGGTTNLEANLGKKIEAPGGSTTLNVVGRHTLRAVRDYPNNIAVVTMTIVGNSCRMTLENRLKRGKRVYSFYSNSGVSYCSHVQITRTECTPY
jgi:hypothetical protein